LFQFCKYINKRDYKHIGINTGFDLRRIKVINLLNIDVDRCGEICYKSFKTD